MISQFGTKSKKLQNLDNYYLFNIEKYIEIT